jgi:hypothetical protein
MTLKEAWELQERAAASAYSTWQKARHKLDEAARTASVRPEDSLERKAARAAERAEEAAKAAYDHATLKSHRAYVAWRKEKSLVP